MSNYITVYGNLTRDPEVRRTTSDMAIVGGGVASNRREKKGDEWRNVATFFEFKILAKRGETFARFHKKGSKAFLVGTITTESWTDKRSGEEKSKQVLLVNEWEFCNAKDEAAGDEPYVEDVARPEEGGPLPWEKR